jgi:branched-chain amino acid transport system ATP-binding protein
MTLSLTDVNTFYGDSHILNNVSMQIDATVPTALLGRNGAGKTTLVRSVMGFTRARSGEIRWSGTPVQDLPPYRVSRSGLAVVPQGRHIFKSLTVAENLKIAGRGGRHAPDRRFDLDRVFELFPRLRERAGNYGDQLSGGEQQMLAIGRALMTNPSFILMDEPSEGLAPIIVDALAETIRSLRDLGLGLLLVEQNLRLALDCTEHAFVLSKGEVVWSGPISTIRDDHELRKKHLAV